MVGRKSSLLFRRPLKEPHDTLQDGEDGLLAENRIGPWAVLEGNFMFLVSNDSRGRFLILVSPKSQLSF